MNPLSISKMIEQANKTKMRDYDPVVPFILSWVAWESLRTRMLVVASRYKGYKISDAYTAIGKLKISNNNMFSDCFKNIVNFNFKSDPKPR
jgi:hypothetical protein